MKISIVMPSYNQGRFVDEALRSVIDQDYPDKEILFIDGGSTDQTMAIVERHANEIAHYVCEPDDGQSDALRKGFGLAKGDILTWLNTDDIMLPGTLREVAEIFARDGECQWALGNVVWIDAAGQILLCRKGEAYSPTMSRLGVLTAYGPSAFFKRELYSRVGGVNRALHYMMDTELWWRFAMSGARCHRLNRYAWALRLHEDAKMSGHLFAKADDPQQLRIARAKEAERQHIKSLTQSYRMRIPRALSMAVTLAWRGSSPAYLKGRYDSRLWQGRQLEEFMEVQCAGR